MERGEDVLQFHHALVQDVAYSQLLVRRRRELHLQVADAAESLYGAHDDAIDLLARHLYLAKAGARAVPYLTRAGERAKALFANDEAIIHFRRAAELAPDGADVQLQLGDLHELVGEYDEALRFYRMARDMTNDVRAWRGLASTRRKCGEYWEALAEVDAAFAAEPLKGQDLAPLWLEAGWVLLLSSRIDQAVDVFGAGVEASPRPYGPNAGLLLIQLAKAETLQGGYESALDHALSGQSILEEHGDTRGLVTALRVLGSAYSFLERIEEAESAMRRALELADRVGSVEEIGACLMNLGYFEYRRDRFADAISYGRRAIEEFKRVGLSSGLAQAYTNLADALEQSGELEEALEYCELAQEVGRAIGYPMSIADTTNTIACVELKRKNYTAAATKAEEAAQLYLEIGSGPKATEILELAAEAWEKAGDRERARACTARAREVVAA
jgi:tetratricopeptide (TPR) repeat protein